MKLGSLLIGMVMFTLGAVLAVFGVVSLFEAQFGVQLDQVVIAGVLGFTAVALATHSLAIWHSGRELNYTSLALAGLTILVIWLQMFITFALILNAAYTLYTAWGQLDQTRILHREQQGA